jgi:hypothetical protein
MDDSALEQLLVDPALTPVTALLLADGGFFAGMASCKSIPLMETLHPGQMKACVSLFLVPLTLIKRSAV